MVFSAQMHMGVSTRTSGGIFVVSWVKLYIAFWQRGMITVLPSLIVEFSKVAFTNFSQALCLEHFMHRNLCPRRAVVARPIVHRHHASMHHHSLYKFQPRLRPRAFHAPQSLPTPCGCRAADSASPPRVHAPPQPLQRGQGSESPLSG